jgi:tRNA A-37 threonylcarbamoyl transferase component Bud32
MSTPTLSIRPGHPPFLDLPWELPLAEWPANRVIDLPTGVHRHEVRFVAYDENIYVIKELPRKVARHEYRTLRALRQRVTPVATVVGLVDRDWVSGDREHSGAIITQYVTNAFTYRELISGGNFGPRRDQMLDAVAGLLVELHLAGLFWGDCSLSNLLYRYDAGAIEAIMIDAETSALHDELSDGQRLHDLDIMIVNVAGGMADIAASQGLDIDEADMSLGEDVAGRYEGLWNELTTLVTVGPDEGYKVRERVERLNALGFEVEDLDLEPSAKGDDRRMRLRVTVGGRNFHRARLRELTGIDASEQQARQILADLHYYEATSTAVSATGKSVTAIRWRVDVFEPLLLRIAAAEPDAVVVQRYCDFLHHRYLLARRRHRDVTNEEAFESWMQEGRPGYDPETTTLLDPVDDI